MPTFLRLPLWSGLLLAALAFGCTTTDRTFAIDEFEFSAASWILDSAELYLDAGEAPIIEAELRSSMSRVPEVEVSAGDDLLVVHQDCPPAPGECVVRFDAVLPAATATSLNLASGSAEITGMRADITGAMSSGRTVFEDIRADLIDFRMSSGTLTGRTLSVDTLNFEMTSGDVGLELSTAPLDVDITSTSGTLTLTVPVADYDLVLSNTSGAINVTNLQDSVGATRTIRVHCTSGTVNLIGV